MNNFDFEVAVVSAAATVKAKVAVATREAPEATISLGVSFWRYRLIE